MTKEHLMALYAFAELMKRVLESAQILDFPSSYEVCKLLVIRYV